MNDLSIDQSLLKAKSLKRSDQTDNTISICEKILDEFPNNQKAKGKHSIIMVSLIKKSEDQLIAMMDKGNFSSMANFANKLTKKIPNSIIFWNLCGIANINLNNFQMAESNFTQACKIDSSNPYIWANLASSLNYQRKFNEALDAYKKGITLKPDFHEAICDAGEIFNKLNKPTDALSCFIKTIEINKNYIKAWMFIGHTIKYLKFTNPNLKIQNIILLLLDHKSLVRPSGIALCIVSLIISDKNIKDIIFSIQQKNSNISFSKIIEVLSNQKLLIKLMSVCPLPSIELENILKKVRHTILTYIDIIPNEFKILFFQSSLALQCFINEYIYEITDVEKENVNKLEQIVETYFLSGKQPKLSYIFCLASYKPLHSYWWSNLLKIPEEFIDINKQMIKDKIEEQTISKKIKTLVKISDCVSQKVRDQYEMNPYPKWELVDLPLKSYTINELIRNCELKIFDRKIETITSPNILIAGCGTGQQSINTSRKFKNSKLLAIDLSLNSLSYAKRKTEEIGINNIEYIHADILDLHRLQKKFHIIECVGVLHHMNKPDLGWKKLVDHLEPGGLMKIGLYSKLARLDITKIKLEIDKLKINTDLVSMKIFRNKIISSGEHHHKKMIKIQDFYNMSNFRDLLFHTQETHFTILEIKEHLSNLGLKFCGFEDTKNNNKFETKFKIFDDRYDLKKWHNFEVDNPNIFLNMYQFWCQKVN